MITHTRQILRAWLDFYIISQILKKNIENSLQKLYNIKRMMGKCMEKQNWLTRFLRIIFLVVFIIIGIIFFTKQIIPDKELMVSIVSIILLFMVGGIFIVFGLILDYNSKKNAGLC